LQQVRDEAHRFAITGHRNGRAKARKTSTLEDIVGFGPENADKIIGKTILVAFKEVKRAGVRRPAESGRHQALLGADQKFTNLFIRTIKRS